MQRSAWLHIILTTYLLLMDCIPLGNWNYQQGQYLLPAVFAGQGIEPGDIFLLIFVTIPAILFWIAYKRRNVWFGISALIFDLIWLVMQIQSWWLPYIFGTNKTWQLEYVKGRTTKILPSFGHHIAPDAMHFFIQVLLVSALITGIYGVYRLKWKPA
jgi:hypothetical protein